MTTTERVTVTLPTDLVREIAPLEKNRSRFIQVATRCELERRRRELLRQSLRNPHPDTAELAEAGFQEWASSLPEEDASSRIDFHTGTAVQWIPDKGWTQVET